MRPVGELEGPPNKDLAELRWLFEHLRREFIWLQQCFETYLSLYDSGQELLDLLDLASAEFFRDHNWLINDHIRLNIWKITDLGHIGLRKESLTIKNVDARLEALGLGNGEITRVSGELHQFRDKVSDSRNKIIAHADVLTLKKGEPVGGLADGEMEKFFDDLHAYSDLVGEACGLGPLEYRHTGRAGAVLQLLQILTLGLKSKASGRRRKM